MKQTVRTKASHPHQRREMWRTSWDVELFTLFAELWSVLSADLSFERLSFLSSAALLIAISISVRHYICSMDHSAQYARGSCLFLLHMFYSPTAADRKYHDAHIIVTHARDVDLLPVTRANRHLWKILDCEMLVLHMCLHLCNTMISAADRQI